MLNHFIGVSMNFNSLISDVKCNDSDKRSLFPLITRILEIHDILKKDGLLVLESILNENDEHYLKKYLISVAEGIDPENLLDNISHDLNNDNNEGILLLTNLMIAMSAISIQNGESRDILRQKLFFCIGPELENEYKSPELSMDEIFNFLNKNSG
jgi:hypothetical protein